MPESSTPHTADAPMLEALMRRLAETPPEFLAEPRMGTVGEVHVDAVVADMLLRLGAQPWDAQLLSAHFACSAKTERNRLRSTLIACWLFADPAFAGQGDVLWRWLSDAAGDWNELTRQVPAEQWVQDGERREELVRLALAACGLRPAGEGPEQAADRLSAISTAQRRAAVAAARAAEERARQVRAEIERKRAEEAAAKPSRE